MFRQPTLLQYCSRACQQLMSDMRSIAFRGQLLAGRSVCWCPYAVRALHHSVRPLHNVDRTLLSVVLHKVDLGYRQGRELERGINGLTPSSSDESLCLYSCILLGQRQLVSIQPYALQAHNLCSTIETNVTALDRSTLHMIVALRAATIEYSGSYCRTQKFGKSTSQLRVTVAAVAVMVTIAIGLLAIVATRPMR